MLESMLASSCFFTSGRLDPAQRISVFPLRCSVIVKSSPKSTALRVFVDDVEPKSKKCFHRNMASWDLRMEQDVRSAQMKNKQKKKVVVHSPGRLKDSVLTTVRVVELFTVDSIVQGVGSLPQPSVE